MVEVTKARLLLALLGILTVRQASADKVMTVSVQRLTYDSDVVFVGRAVGQSVVKGGFVFIDTDGMEKRLDVAMTTFAVDTNLKGPERTTLDVCSIVEPRRYADLETGETYILFLQKSGTHLQRTYGSLSQIEIVAGRIGTHFLGSDELGSVATVEATIRQAATAKKKRFRAVPYNPYGDEPYRIISNVCAE